VWCQRNYLSFTCGFTSLCRFLPLALNARLFVVLSTARFSENSILLNLAIEALQCGLKCFILADFDFRHPESPPSRPLFEV
jgi:hypothetical protein